MHYLLTGEILSHAKVTLPSGEGVFIPVFKDKDSFFSIKDAGDDPDVTDGARIIANIYDIKNIPEDISFCVNFFSDERFPWLFLTGGKGVGVVTKEGLEQEVGFSAINKVPREMIFSSVFKELSRGHSRGQAPCLNCEQAVTSFSGYLIVISVENGEEIAKKTFNERLGIEGGISILGTTGIVEPMSEKALVKSIEAEMRVALSSSGGNIFAAPGNYGERYIRENNITTNHVVLCSNYIGETIDLAVHLNAKSLTIVGNCGKLCKLAAGIMNTHSRMADGRFEIFAANAALAKAPFKCIEKLKECITTDEMLSILTEYGIRETVVDNMISAIREHITYRAGKLPVHVIMYSEKYGLLGRF